jgi:AcrR family transcriptional regulator
MAAMPETQAGEGLRKTPVQARSRQKVAAILAAARDLILAGRLADLSIETLAARAEVSVGTIYQFFATKDAVLNELARQTRSRAEWWLREQRSPPVRSQDWTTRLNLLITGMAEAWRADTTAQVIWAPKWSTPEIRRAADDFYAELVTIVKDILTDAGVARGRRAAMAAVMVDSMASVLERWCRAGCPDDRVPPELQAMLAAYIEQARPA